MKIRSYRLGKSGLLTAFITSLSLTSAGTLASSSQGPGKSPENTSIETVVVTASRVPLQLDKTGSAITVISREDIERRKVISLGELLRDVPGLAVNQAGPRGSLTQVRSRGAEANQLLVLIDGIEANDPALGSEFNFAHVLVDDIDRIEIVRGPQSALWGSDAMAGVVHIITRQQPSQGAEMTARTGSFGTRQITARYDSRFDKGYASISLGNLESDGTNISRTGSEEDGYRNKTYAVNAGYQISDDITLAFSHRDTDSENDFDGTSFMTGLPFDSRFVSETDLRYSQLRLDGEQLGGKIRHSLSTALTDTQSVNHTGGLIPDAYLSQKRRYAYQISFSAASGDNTVSMIVEHETVDYQQRGQSAPWGDPNQNRSAESNSFALEYLKEFNDLTLSASIRQEMNDEFKDATPWRLTASYNLFQDTRIHASFGESSKNPTFVERFGYFTNFLGNENLQAEKSKSWEIGIDQDFMNEQLNLSALYFSAELEDEINGFWFSPTLLTFTAANVEGLSKRQGAEISLDWHVTASLDAKLAYTYTDSTEEVGGRQIDELRRPRHTGSFNLNQTFTDAINLNLAIQYNGVQDDIFYPPWPLPAQRVELDEFTLVSLTYQHKLTRQLSLTLSADNLLDEDYEQVYGFRSSGRAFYIAMEVNW